MLTGAHIVVYTKNPEADREFFKEILDLRSVDAGHGWLIFAIPAAEVAFHPHQENDKHEMYFMCEDIEAQVTTLKKKGVRVGGISEQRWGTLARLALPGGGSVGLYEPKHPVTFERNLGKKETRQKNRPRKPARSRVSRKDTS